MRSATLEERAAFLLALFAHPRMFHGAYIAEKIEHALAEGVKPATLEALLDEENRERYHYALTNVRQFAWERAWKKRNDDAS